MLRTSGLVDDVMFSYNGPYDGVTLQQQSRHNECTANTPAAWYRLRPVLVDVGRQC